MAEATQRVADETGIQLKSGKAAGPFKRLLDAGVLVEYPVLEGGEWQRSSAYTYRVADLDEISLETLYDLALENSVEKGRGRRGRRATADRYGSRRLLTVSKGQLKLIRTAVGRLVEAIAPIARKRKGDDRDQETRIREGMREIGVEELVWADGAGPHGHGDWELLERAETALSGDYKKATVRGYISALRNLLDLGASHGFLIPREVHGATRTYVPASWSEALTTWKQFVESSDHGYRSAGTAPLSRIMSTMAERFSDDLDAVNPLELTEEQTTAFLSYFKARLDADEHLTKQRRTANLATLRALMDAGVLVQQDLNQYDRRSGSNRKSAYHKAPQREIASAFDPLARTQNPPDYSLFLDLRKGGFFKADNPYSLPRVVDWFTIQVPRDREDRGLLDEPNKFPRVATRSVEGGRSGSHWAEATIEVHLERLGLYLGFVESVHGVNLDDDAVDARHIFTPELVRSFYDAVRAKGKAWQGNPWTGLYTGAWIMHDIAMFCSPVFEHAVLTVGDDERFANQFRHTADLASGRGEPKGDGTFGGTLRKSLEKTLELQREAGARNGDEDSDRDRAALHQKVYQEVTGEKFSYIPMFRVRNASIERFCRKAGVDSLEQLAEQMTREENPRVLENNEFVMLRNLAMWSDSLALPSRRHTIARLLLSHRKEGPGGELRAEIPAHLLKAGKYNKDQKVRIGTRGTSGGEYGYRMDLWDVYLLARSRYLGDAESDVLYLSTGGRGYQLSDGQVNKCFASALEYGGEELGWDVSLILNTPGLGTAHGHRHALGHYMVHKNKLEVARILLHHKSYKTLLETYTTDQGASSAEEAIAEAMGVA